MNVPNVTHQGQITVLNFRLEQSKHADALQRERDKLLSEIAKITEKLNNALIYQEELERRTSVTDLKMAEIGEQLEVRSTLIQNKPEVRHISGANFGNGEVQEGQR